MYGQERYRTSPLPSPAATHMNGQVRAVISRTREGSSREEVTKGKATATATTTLTTATTTTATTTTTTTSV